MNPSCTSCQFLQDIDDGNKFIILEDWSSEEDCDKDCVSDNTKKYIEQLGSDVTVTLEKLKSIS